MTFQSRTALEIWAALFSAAARVLRLFFLITPVDCFLFQSTTSHDPVDYFHNPVDCLTLLLHDCCLAEPNLSTCFPSRLEPVDMIYPVDWMCCCFLRRLLHGLRERGLLPAWIAASWGMLWCARRRMEFMEWTEGMGAWILRQG